jgi:hypothetical protein
VPGQHLDIPIYVTTQNRKALGQIVDELALYPSQSIKPAVDVDKTLFSMCVPGIQKALPAKAEVIIVGIEAHM